MATELQFMMREVRNDFPLRGIYLVFPPIAIRRPLTLFRCLIDSSPVARTTSNSKDYKVVVHNGGGPSYDERRSASWDKGRWK